MNILFGPEEKFFLLRVFALTPNICKPVIGQKIVSLDQGVSLIPFFNLWVSMFTRWVYYCFFGCLLLL